MATIDEENANRVDNTPTLEVVRNALTGSPFVSLRTLGLLMVAAACVSTAPFPASLIGVVACAWLGFDLGRKK